MAKPEPPDLPRKRSRHDDDREHVQTSPSGNQSTVLWIVVGIAMFLTIGGAIAIGVVALSKTELKQTAQTNANGKTAKEEQPKGEPERLDYAAFLRAWSQNTNRAKETYIGKWVEVDTDHVTMADIDDPNLAISFAPIQNKEIELLDKNGKKLGVVFRAWLKQSDVAHLNLEKVKSVKTNARIRGYIKDIEYVRFDFFDPRVILTKVEYIQQ